VRGGERVTSSRNGARIFVLHGTKEALTMDDVLRAQKKQTT